LHDDPNAQTNGNWQQWNINLASFSSGGVNLHHIKYFYMGLGQRCNYLNNGGEGTVRFDNLRLYPSSCVLEYGPTADLTGDCNVNMSDVDAMVRDWLDSDKTVNISPIAQPNAPVLWYKFDETAGPNVSDAVGDFNGTIYNLGPETWEAAGGYDGNGCINFYYGRNTYVTVPPQVLNFVSTTNKFSVSLWVNSDPVHTPGDTWPQVFDVIKGANEVLQLYCPAPLPPIYPYGPGVHYDVNGFTVARDNMRLSDFAGRWNHFVVTRDGNAGTMAIYLNGQDVNESNNVTVGMFTPPVDRFYIGTRDQWWGYWAGRVDDFRVYDYALSAAEAGYIATRGTGEIYLPLGSPANLEQSGPPQAINFKDYSILAQQWLTQQLWP